MNPANIPLYHIFLTVARSSSISGAAKSLYISQPAVSKSIKKLEESLGVSLIKRSSKGITLTNEGNILYRYLHSAFETISAGEDTLRHIHELGIGHIRIGVSSTLCKHILLPCLKDFLTEYPHMQITISGQIHDIFVSSPQYAKGLIERENISSNDIINNSNLILLDKNNLTRKFINNYLSSWEISSDTAMEVNSMELLIDFVKTGLGVGCIIKEFIKEELNNKSLIQIKTPSTIKPRQICFAYSKSLPSDSACTSLINFLKSRTFY